MLHPYERQKISRRAFVRGVAGGLAVGGIPLAYVAARNNHWLAGASVTPATKPVVDELARPLSRPRCRSTRSPRRERTQ